MNIHSFPFAILMATVGVGFFYLSLKNFRESYASFKRVPEEGIVRYVKQWRILNLLGYALIFLLFSVITEFIAFHVITTL